MLLVQRKPFLDDLAVGLNHYGVSFCVHSVYLCTSMCCATYVLVIFSAGYFQFIDLVRGKRIGSIVCYDEREQLSSGREVLQQFKVKHSAQQSRKEREVAVLTNLETVLFMLEGNI